MDRTSELIVLAEQVVLEPSLYGAYWIALISFVGELIAPLPSSLLFAGQLLLSDESVTVVFVLKLLSLVAFPIALGTTLGSYLSYGIAYFGGKPAIEKTKRYIRFSWEDVERFEAKFQDKWYDELIFLALRSIPLLPTIPINVLAGVLRMNFWSYTLLTLLGTSIRMMIMLFVFGVGGGNVLIEVLDL
jgi:membrane protein DedA with SNARE-associated domain